MRLPVQNEPLRLAVAGPHDGLPVLIAGSPLGVGRAAVILFHGRGGSATDMLSLANALQLPDYTFLLPEAVGNAWYPYTFLSPIEKNEPWLSSALAAVSACLAQATGAGIPLERIAIGGFSQGACLASDWLVRKPARLGAAAILSGGVIGPEDRTWNTEGDLGGMPVFLGCSDRDSHVPAFRVRDTANLMTALGARVTMQLYPNFGHTISTEEVRIVRDMLLPLEHQA